MGVTDSILYGRQNRLCNIDSVNYICRMSITNGRLEVLLEKEGKYRVCNGVLQQLSTLEWKDVPVIDGIVRMQHPDYGWISFRLIEVLEYSGVAVHESRTNKKNEQHFNANGLGVLAPEMIKNKFEGNSVAKTPKKEIGGKRGVAMSRYEEIKKLHLDGVTNSDIARRLELKRPTVINIVNKIKAENK